MWVLLLVEYEDRSAKLLAEEEIKYEVKFSINEW